jgi:hypothetical protein
MLEKITSGYKALTVFVVGFGGFLAATNGSPEFAAALPQGFAQWLTMIGVPAVLGAGAWLTRNQYTVEEADEFLRRARLRASEGKS